MNARTKRILGYVALVIGIYSACVDATDTTAMNLREAATIAATDPCAITEDTFFNPCADITTTHIEDQRHNGTPVFFTWEDDSQTVCIHQSCYNYTDDIRGKMIGQSEMGAHLR
jgi:hypothetical protein